MSLFKVTRTSQPQQPVGIDWGNPITRGLVFAWIPASDQLTKSGAVGKEINSLGVGVRTNGSSTYEYMNSSPVFSLDDCSMTAVLKPTNTANASIYAVACGSSASNNPLFMLGQGATSHYLGFRTRDTAGTDVTVTGTSSDWTNGITSVVTGTRSKSAALQRVFANGRQVASTAVGTASATTFDRFAIGCLLRSSAALHWDGTTNLVLIHNRALSDAEIKSLSDNPWQIFQPTNRAIWLPAPAGGGTGNASGSLDAVSLTPPTATGAGSAAASGSLASVSITGPTATASGGAAGNASASPDGVTLTPPTATATGSASASATPSSVSITPPTATASAGGTGNAFAAFMALVLSPAAATASGGASATGLFSGISLMAPAATAYGGSSIQVAGSITRPTRNQQSDRPRRVQSGSRPARIG